MTAQAFISRLLTWILLSVWVIPRSVALQGETPSVDGVLELQWLFEESMSGAEQDPTSLVSYSADGRWIAVPGRFGPVVLNAETGAVRGRAESLSFSSGSGATFLADSEHVAMGYGTSLRAYDLNGAPTSTLGVDWPWGLIRFSTNNEWIATSFESRGVDVWRMADLSARPIHLKISGGELTALAFSPDGQRLACGLHTGNITVWSIPGGQLLYTIVSRYLGDGLPHQVMSVTFSESGSELAAAFNGGVPYQPPPSIISPGVVAVWDAGTARELWSVTNMISGNSAFRDVAFSPDGSLVIATELLYQAMRFISFGGAVQRRYNTLRTPACECNRHAESVAVSPDGRSVAYNTGVELVVVKMPLMITGIDSSHEETVIRWVGSAARHQVQRSARADNPIWEDVGEPTTARAHTNKLTSVSFYRIIEAP